MQYGMAVHANRSCRKKSLKPFLTNTTTPQKISWHETMPILPSEFSKQCDLCIKLAY